MKWFTNGLMTKMKQRVQQTIQFMNDVYIYEVNLHGDGGGGKNTAANQMQKVKVKQKSNLIDISQNSYCFCLPKKKEFTPGY